jgi:anti-sigma factor RsiW
MNCELYDERLDDYVDGARPADRPGDDRLAAFERHLAGCARCQAVVADFTRIRRTAATLEEHIPPPRLWAGIAATLEGKRRRVPAWLPMAAAATLALLVGGAAWIDWRQPVVAPRQEAAAPAESTALPVEARYDEAIAGLQQVAEVQDAALDPDTRAVLKQSLAVIDRAISESRAAVASDPASALAQDSLIDALDTKVALLQDTVTLGSERN